MLMFLQALYFVFVTLLCHPLAVTIVGFIVFVMSFNRIHHSFLRNIDSDQLSWFKTVSSLDDIRLVWCDSSSGSEKDTEEALRRIDPNLLIIHDRSTCQQMIERLHRYECKTILLILPGSIATELISSVISDVYAIFIFCLNAEAYLELPHQSKVDSVSVSTACLIRRIENCISAMQRRLILEHQQQPLRDLKRDNVEFIWFQVLRKVLEDVQRSRQAEEDLLTRFLDYYHDSPLSQNKVKNFVEEYDPEDALWWYTKPDLVSDPLNKALRALDVDALIDLRYFIADMCRKLKTLPRPIDKQPFYRGVLMDKSKFEHLRSNFKCGDLVSTRGFLSTSLDFNIAEIYSSNDRNDPKKIEIIYRIEVPPDVKHVVYANIAGSSAVSDEEEVLFDLDSVFSLPSFEPDPMRPDRWVINLRATDMGRELAEKHIADADRQLQHVSPEILLGTLLIDKGDYDKALPYFERILAPPSIEEQQDELPIQSRITRSIVMNYIGRAWFLKGDHQRALDYFDKALALQEQEPALNDQIVFTMNNKGVLLMMNDELEPALTAFQRALNQAEQLKQLDRMADLLSNMAVIKIKSGDYDDALDILEKERDALQEVGIHDEHWRIAQNLLHSAFVYCDQARWPDAYKTLQRVREIQQKVLPPTHVDIARTCFMMGTVLRNQEKFVEALDQFRRALAIYERVLQPNHSHIANTYNSMANLQAVQEKFDEALPLYKQALEQFRKHYGKEEHSDIARVFNNMGQAYRLEGDFEAAKECLTRALHLRQVTAGYDHPDTATTWVNLALLFRAQNNLSAALERAKTGLDIRRRKLQPGHEDLVETEELVNAIEQQISNSTETEA